MCSSRFPILLFRSDDFKILKLLLSNFVADRDRNLHFVREQDQWKLLPKKYWIAKIYSSIESYASHCKWQVPSEFVISKVIYQLYKPHVYEKIYGPDTQFIVSTR